MKTNDRIINYLNKNKINIKEILVNNNLYYNFGSLFFEFESEDYSFIRNNKKLCSSYKYELSKIFRELHQLNIQVITFKGIVLSDLLYDNFGERFLNDIDIYVEKESFKKTLEVLLHNGFKPKSKDSINNEHHILLKKDHIILELHKNIFHPMIGIDESVLFSQYSNHNVDGFEFLTFNTTNTLHHLIYHLYMDTWLNSNFYPILTIKDFAKANRFLYRAYEIALFSEKYFNEINWEEITNDIKNQKLRIIFKKMIYDILEIFPEAFPKEFVDTVNAINYIDDERDNFYKYVKEFNISEENIGNALSNFIDSQWNKKQENNIQIYNNGDFVLDNTIIKDDEIEKDYQLMCVVNVEKVYDDVKLEFKISNNDFYFSDIGNCNTQASDGVHLIICGTEKYSYNSIFLFPKKIDNKITVVPVDVLNSVNREIDENFIFTTYDASERDYTITAILKKDFLQEFNLEKYFYLGLVISDCSSKTQKRKSELILSNPHSEWYNPIHFAKINISQ